MEGRLSSFSKSIIIRLTHKVAYNLTRNNENIQGKVDEIIGGQIIELDVIKARQEGEEKGIRAFIEDKLQDGVAVEIIQKKLERRFKLTQEQAKGFIQKYAKIKTA